MPPEDDHTEQSDPELEASDLDLLKAGDKLSFGAKKHGLVID